MNVLVRCNPDAAQKRISGFRRIYSSTGTSLIIGYWDSIPSCWVNFFLKDDERWIALARNKAQFPPALQPPTNWHCDLDSDISIDSLRARMNDGYSEQWSKNGCYKMSKGLSKWNQKQLRSQEANPQSLRKFHTNAAKWTFTCKNFYYDSFRVSTSLVFFDDLQDPIDFFLA